MNNLEQTTDSLIEAATATKRRAQTLGNFLKSTKVKKYLEPVLNLRCDTIDVMTWTGESTLYINVQVKDLEGFTDPRFAGILNIFEYLKPFDTRCDDNANALSREIRYQYEERMSHEAFGRARVYVAVTGRVKEDSATCHRVQIGMTDPKPMPIYKIVCDDPTATPADAATPADSKE